jgi:hypothetical protein
MNASMRSYLAECFWPGVQHADLHELDSRAITRLTLSGAQHVCYRGSMLMPDDEVVFCFFEATSAAAVEAAARNAGIPFARIVASTGMPDTPIPPGRSTT